MRPHRHLDAALVADLQARFVGGDRDFVNFNTFLSGAQYGWFHALCSAYLSSGSEVLDWGAGNGHASQHLLRAGHRVVAYSFEAPRPVPPHFADRYRFVPGEPLEPIRLPFSSNAFDAVCSVGVLEHVREFDGDEAASLNELRRVTRPGGLLICVHLPNRGGWIEALIERLRLPGHLHRYRYGVDEVRSLFESTGWTILQTRRYGVLPRNRVTAILPASLCNASRFVRWYDTLDEIGARLFPMISQNHFVVARAT